MNKRVVIVGGGVVGLCTAWYCRQRGWDVTVIERHPAQRTGCSFGNAGMIVPSHFVPLAAPGMVWLGLRWMLDPESPFYIRPRCSWELLRWGFHFCRACNRRHVEHAAPLLRDLNLASRACYEELAEALGNEFGLVRNGLLMYCKTPQTLEAEAHLAEQANALGVPAQVLDATAAAAIDPQVTVDVAGAIYFPRDCHLSPDRLMASLQRRLDARGCRFLWNNEVTGFVTRNERLLAVKTASEELPVDEVVLAAGAWSSRLGGQLRLTLPMQAGKGYSLTLEQPRQLPNICSIFTEARLAVTPMNGRLRFGGTMELSGLSDAIDARRVQGIVRSIPRYFPAFQPDDFAGIKPWQGLRPCSPDGLPFVGRTCRWSNLIAATGHAMMGLSLGPITGRLVGQLIARESPGVDLHLLSPDRYA